MLKKTIPSLLGALALAVPSAEAWAAAHETQAKAKPKKRSVAAKRHHSKAKKKKRVLRSTETVLGPAVRCDRWGPLQVSVKVRKTTTIVGKRKRVALKILAVDTPVYPDKTFRTRYINSQALPLLHDEVLEAQSVKGLEMISGATDTTVAFKKSLQAALLKARK